NEPDALIRRNGHGADQERQRMRHSMNTVPHPPLRARDGGLAPVILVIEEDAAIRALLNVGLSSKGYRVLLAATGAEALHIYQQNPRGIDLVFLQAEWFGGEGEMILNALRQLDPNLRCCF